MMADQCPTCQTIFLILFHVQGRLVQFLLVIAEVHFHCFQDHLFSEDEKSGNFECLFPLKNMEMTWI